MVRLRVLIPRRFLTGAISQRVSTVTWEETRSAGGCILHAGQANRRRVLAYGSSGASARNMEYGIRLYLDPHFARATLPTAMANCSAKNSSPSGLRMNFAPGH